MAFRLVDDGTLDTVVACCECDERVRFDSLSLVEGFEGDEDEADDYRVQTALDEAEEEHECSAR